MIYWIVYPITYVVIKLAALVIGRLKSSGHENVPRTGGMIYCPNHQSDSDPAVLLVSLPRRAWFVGKEELFRIPLATSLFRALHGIPIKRDSPDRSALRRIEELLKKDQAVVIFPEGRCSPTGRLQRIQPGAAMLALRTGALIVPVGIKHTDQLLPYGSIVPRFTRQRVSVEFGQPIDPADFEKLPKNQRTNVLTERLGREIAALVGQEPPSISEDATQENERSAAVDTDMQNGNSTLTGSSKIVRGSVEFAG
jgi:1-acyl-sn-glycerol-3-phosphate acyltransferase